MNKFEEKKMEKNNSKQKDKVRKLLSYKMMFTFFIMMIHILKHTHKGRITQICMRKN